MIINQQGQEIFSKEATHPGEMINDELEVRGITQRELATRLGVSAAFVNALIHERKSISLHLAMKLEKALEVDAAFWLNAQKQYNRTLAYHKAKRELDQLHVPVARHAELLRAVA
jgi:antitoxin HigA-1